MNARPIRLRQLGVTAIELLITLAIAAIIATAGIPALRDVSMSARRTASVNAFLGLVQFARSSAQTHAEQVILCRANDAQRCSPGEDAAHWMLISESQLQPLRVVRTDFSGRVRSNRAQFQFRPFPNTSVNGTVSFCDSRGGRHDRAVIISRSGRARIARPESDAGLPACADT